MNLLTVPQDWKVDGQQFGLTFLTMGQSIPSKYLIPQIKRFIGFIQSPRFFLSWKKLFLSPLPPLCLVYICMFKNFDLEPASLSHLLCSIWWPFFRFVSFLAFTSLLSSHKIHSSRKASFVAPSLPPYFFFLNVESILRMLLFRSTVRTVFCIANSCNFFTFFFICLAFLSLFFFNFFIHINYLVISYSG